MKLFNKIIFLWLQTFLKLISPCEKLSSKLIWTKSFDSFSTESAIRMLDANNDHILDVVIGFAIDESDIQTQNDCKINSILKEDKCAGGLLVLDGQNGNVLRKFYLRHEVFAISCSHDLGGDGNVDCVVGGRSATLAVIDIINDKILWNFEQSIRNELLNLYTGQLIEDVDGDMVKDLVIVHAGDPFAAPGDDKRLNGKMLVLSGRNGGLLWKIDLPEGKDSFYSPVVTRNNKNVSDMLTKNWVLVGTGGETQKGSLWKIPLKAFEERKSFIASKVYTPYSNGIMTPPCLSDLNTDEIDDVIFTDFNSSIVALDGRNFEQLWSYTFPQSQTYATPAPGLFNDDDVTDFLVQMAVGPAYPHYYYYMTMVIDGSTGLPITKTHYSPLNIFASPLTIRVRDKGNDIFLFWTHECENASDFRKPFLFPSKKGQVDVCKLRFNSSDYTRLYAWSQQQKPQPLFDSRAHETKNDGIDYVISTGSLAPPISGGEYDELNSIDVVFAKFKSFPTEKNLQKRKKLVINRIKLICECGKKCEEILPYEKQWWSGYMGQNANSYWN